MIAKGLTVGMLQENCYVVGCEQTGVGVIIDPGDSGRAILEIVKEMGLTIQKIINTHAHFDHVLAVNEVKDATGATFHLHKQDLPVLQKVPESVRAWFDMDVEPVFPPDEFLVHGQEISFGKEVLEVRFTPGHSPGHVIFIDHHNRQVFGGDTLFQGSIGRYDLPGADGPTLLRSIRDEILTLDDDYTVFPGHGNATQIGVERIHNPFVGQNAEQ